MIDGIVTDFIEFHGDRQNGDDPSIIGGIGYLGDQAVTIIAIDKGKDITDKMAKRNGSPEPYGYRKAQRLMAQAAKFDRPIITLINTPGAFPGKTAEEQCQGDAIAQSILKSMSLTVPMIAIVYGEAGSGGALALATADEVWMFQNTTYSILSPEGFASILWKDVQRADEAAEIMGLTPKDLLANKVIDKIVSESHTHSRIFHGLQKDLSETFARLQALTPAELLEQRRQRFRAF